MSEDRYLAAVDSLYEAALHPKGWPEFLVAFNGLLNGWVGQYMVWDDATRTNVLSFVSEPTLHQDEMRYSAHYGAIDPRRQLLAAQPYQWVFCHEHFDERFVAGSEFYQDFLIPIGGRYLAAVQFGEHHGLMPIIGMHRGSSQGPFGAREHRWMTRLQPHIARAIQLHLKAYDLGLKADLTARALDALSYPIILADEHCRVRLTNRAADSWLANNGQLKIGSGVLRFAHQKCQDALVRLIFLAAQGDGARQGGALAIPRRPNSKGQAPKPYSLLVIPLRPDAGLSASWQRSLALLVVVDPEASVPLDVSKVQALFGLTPAEAGLVLAVASTHSLEEAARHAGISLNTAKTQLQSVFEKTGTGRQAELVKLIFSHPSVKSD
ncbi:MAG TPA: helix-turn-helix transcriptional regulator [Casimicrobiaceae bacterium]|nr:helix-turn-helix transcriptional regulator [Casimicrobiaceae bacterium]